MFEVLGLVDRLNVFSTTGLSVLGPSPNGPLSVISLVVAGCWKSPGRPTGTASTISTGANAPRNRAPAPMRTHFDNPADAAAARDWAHAERAVTPAHRLTPRSSPGSTPCAAPTPRRGTVASGGCGSQPLHPPHRSACDVAPPIVRDTAVVRSGGGLTTSAPPVGRRTEPHEPISSHTLL